MHDIGNYHDAQTILQWVRGHGAEFGKPSCVEQEVAPLGWEFIATGSARSVWRSPEGIAYKVAHTARRDYQNTDEVDHLKEAWSKGAPEGCRLPKFSSFDVYDELVVVMEAINGPRLYDYVNEHGNDGEDYYDRMGLCETRFGLIDMHDENVVIDENGLLVPVDFGF
ncbi:MAG TPA: hypothetical protein VIY48_15735 [Candidatus Paceibacterota bacterium]